MRSYMVVAVAMFAFACGKKDEAKTSTKTSEAPAAPSGTTPAAPAAPTTANGVPQIPLMGDPVDTCALVPKDKLEAIVGKVDKWEEDMKPNGGLLGSCSGSGEKAHVSVTARPGKEFKDTVAYMKEKKEIAGVGEGAFWTETGMILKPTGTKYMLQIIAMDPKDLGKQNEAIATEIAKVAAGNAK